MATAIYSHGQGFLFLQAGRHHKIRNGIWQLDGVSLESSFCREAREWTVSPRPLGRQRRSQAALPAPVGGLGFLPLFPVLLKHRKMQLNRLKVTESLFGYNKMKNEMVFTLLAFRIFRLSGGVVSSQKLSEVLSFLSFLEIGNDSECLRWLSWATSFLAFGWQLSRVFQL